MASDVIKEKCILCQEPFTNEKPTVVYAKGLETLCRISKEQNFHDLLEDILGKKESGSDVLVHANCCKKFTDKRKLNSGVQYPRKRLRSSTEFCWKIKCFLCEKLVDKVHSSRKGVYSEVMTIDLREKVLEDAKKRGDEWGNTVMERLISCNDLVAEEAIYHHSCMTNFRLNKVSEKTKGRPVDEDMAIGFEKMCLLLEEDGDCELYTLNELCKKIEDDGSKCYSNKRLKQKLKEKYGDHIFFSESCGRSDIICFKDFAGFVIREKKLKGEDTKENIIEAAAKILRSDIREVNKSKDQYPMKEEIQDIDKGLQWIPELLEIFLQILIPDKVKRTAIGQCIVQIARPRSIICPVPFGVGIQLDKAFGSKWLIRHLFKLGFSISPDEVVRFKHSAVYQEAQSDVDDENTSEEENKFIQWAADNVDHNINTLTGKGTFHGMGIISMSEASSTSKVIQRQKLVLKGAEFGKYHSIQLHQYLGSSAKGLAKLSLENVNRLRIPITLPKEVGYDLLWHALKFSNKASPNWLGYMQDMSSHCPAKPKSFITFLPIIDLNPSDENCIYSTLLFIIKQAKELDVPVPCVTFDQPLWLKASGIIADYDLNIVARLGGFHTAMSFLGGIGKVMKGSGLEELFAEVYAENSVQHMMTGKAVSRSLRAHFLAESALMCILMEELEESKLVDVEPLKLFAESLGDKSQEEVNNFCQSQEMSLVEDALRNMTKELQSKSRTAKLWFQYLRYIGVLKLYIIAERTSNWLLHLHATAEMLNIFAATGHINYAKCTRLYLQQMLKLSETHPWLAEQFFKGNHAVRRSERYWAGLWSDLIIEQTLMRSVKSKGGLTRGRSMHESTRHLWVLSLNYSAEISDAMNQLAGSVIKTSEQHVDLSASRCKKDQSDLQIFKTWLSSRNPFTFEDCDLHSLGAGFISVSGKDDINCEQAEEIGSEIQAKMNWSRFTEIKLKRKDQIRTLDSLQNTIKVDEVKVYVNSTSLFTRLAAVTKREEDEESFFKYEMTTEPLSLFKNEMMRKPDKPSLRKTLIGEDESIELDLSTAKENSICVVDGGALLHRVCWIKGSDFLDIVDSYVRYVRKHYGRAHIIFDGYEGMSTKKAEQLRRGGRYDKCPNVDVKEGTKNTFSQERFLTNDNNKSKLIKILSHYLRIDGNEVINCSDDADTTICAKALSIASSGQKRVILVADDTDILIMLIYHWQSYLNDIIFFQHRMRRGWSIASLFPKLDKVKNHLLFIHAMTGCDTTSAPYGKGKAGFMNLLLKSKLLQDLSTKMHDVWANKDDIGAASVQCCTIMYGGKENDCLTAMRHKKYIDMVCNGALEPAKLPPTERAAYYHGLRVHLQIVTWKILDGSFQLNPEDWGWKTNNNVLIPIQTDLVIAPDSLLKVVSQTLKVRCNCRSIKNQCGSNVCSCRKHGLMCSDLCKGCRGQNCFNSHEEQEFIDDEIDDDEFGNIFDILNEKY